MKNSYFSTEIIADPKICHGKPVFKGTRIMVWQILELLEKGVSTEDIHSAYPHLPADAVNLALHYAAERIKGISYAPLGSEKQTQVFA